MSLQGWNTVYDLGRLLVLILLLIKKQAHYILFVESYTRTIVNIITGQASSLSDSGSSFVTSSVTILSSEAAFSSRERPQLRSHWRQPLAIICHCEVITVQESEWYRALSVSMPATVARCQGSALYRLLRPRQHIGVELLAIFTVFKYFYETKTPNIVPEIMIPDGHFCENPTSDCLYKTMWWFHHYVSVSPRRCPGPAQHYHRTIHVMTLCIRLWSWIMWFSHWHTLESWHTGFHYPYYIFDVCTFLRSFALRRRAGSATRWLAVNCSPPI